MVEEVNGGDNSTDFLKKTQIEGQSTSMEGWNTTRPSMPNTTPVETQKIKKQ